ncbi:MAG: excinuclease ABC subunit UvrC [Methylotetracoccus sp.]|nr:excinuclease ABC subunit UvrC [Methylotetracoccus sp.]
MNTEEITPPFNASDFVQTLTHRPGVYRMLDRSGEVIYVGKAKNLRKRVASHFSLKENSPKQRAMVARVHRVEVTVTHTEREALLLENQLIKAHRPRYNINLRDDKSYPYIHVSTDQDFPRVSFYRGAKRKQGRYFGPFANASAVRESLKLLQKVFRVRQCRDSFFKNRGRPCLQYQINRCTAPCVRRIDAAAYARDVTDTIVFLEGRGEHLITDLVQRMELAAGQQNFEQAARYRDQIATLRGILAKQSIEGERGDLDIIACACFGSMACVQVLFVRNGQQIGDQAFLVPVPEDNDAAHVIAAFIPQYYLERPIPRELLISHEVEDRPLLTEVLTQQAGHPVTISAHLRGERLRRLGLAVTNAESLLASRLSARTDLTERFSALTAALSMETPCTRLECFDISHTVGEQTVASCVVFDRDGPLKSAYRRFNIEGITPGDDYAALAQAVRRRYQRIKKGEIPQPDVLFIDGGKGQVAATCEALSALGMGDVVIVGVAKGPDRRPGMEDLFRARRNERIILPTSSPARLLIQQLRDEAHRFAVAGHRQRRKKASHQSVLETVEGLGPKRRQMLLKHFGGLREISRAGIDALRGVQGIDHQLAERIYATFHHHEL